MTLNWDNLENDKWDNCPTAYKNVHNELTMIGQIVLRGVRIVVPESLRKQVILLAHEGHQRTIKTKQRNCTKVWRPGVDGMVERKCRTCHGFQLVSQPVPPQPVMSTQFPDAPWTDLTADLLGPLLSGDNILLVVYYHSRYFEVDSLKSTTCPMSLRTDNGPQFLSLIV